MASDPAQVVVLSSSLYRAQSLALALSLGSGHNTTAIRADGAVVLGHCSVILIDLEGRITARLPFIRAVVAANPGAKVILLDVVESEENVLGLAEAGASGYVRPGASLEELVAVVESVQNGEFLCTPSITYALFSHLSRLSQRNSAADLPAAVLTLRQTQVLELLSLNLNNKEIAARLCLSEHTVKNHVHRILKKLGVRGRSLACPAVGLPDSAHPAARETQEGF